MLCAANSHWTRKGKIAMAQYDRVEWFSCLQIHSLNCYYRTLVELENSRTNLFTAFWCGCLSVAEHADLFSFFSREKNLIGDLQANRRYQSAGLEKVSQPRPTAKQESFALQGRRRFARHLISCPLWQRRVHRLCKLCAVVTEWLYLQWTSSKALAGASIAGQCMRTDPLEWSAY